MNKLEKFSEILADSTFSQLEEMAGQIISSDENYDQMRILLAKDLEKRIKDYIKELK